MHSRAMFLLVAIDCLVFTECSIVHPGHSSLNLTLILLNSVGGGGTVHLPYSLHTDWQHWSSSEAVLELFYKQSSTWWFSAMLPEISLKLPWWNTLYWTGLLFTTSPLIKISTVYFCILSEKAIINFKTTYCSNGIAVKRDHSVIFTRWRLCAPPSNAVPWTLWSLLSKWCLDWLSRFCRTNFDIRLHKSSFNLYLAFYA